MRILVTGSAGFIGSHLAYRLLGNGHSVVGLDNLDPYYSLKQKGRNLDRLRTFDTFIFLQGDIRHKKIGSIFRQYRPEIVIHLAAKAGVRASMADPRGYFSTNVDGTLNILELARQYGIWKVMAASSSSVYGDNRKVPFSETDPVDSQVSPYAASKRAMEVMAQNYSRVYGLPIQLFRFFTVYGPSGRPDMAPALFSRALLDDQPIKVFGGMDSQRDYTYIDDIVDGLVAAMGMDDQFAVYNLGNNRPEPLSALIAAIESAVGKKARIEIVAKQPGDVEKTWADISWAQKRFGYQPKIQLREGIARHVEWLRDFTLSPS